MKDVRDTFSNWRPAGLGLGDSVIPDLFIWLAEGLQSFFNVLG